MSSIYIATVYGLDLSAHFAMILLGHILHRYLSPRIDATPGKSPHKVSASLRVTGKSPKVYMRGSCKPEIKSLTVPALRPCKPEI